MKSTDRNNWTEITKRLVKERTIKKKKQKVKRKTWHDEILREELE